MGQVGESWGAAQLCNFWGCGLGSGQVSTGRDSCLGTVLLLGPQVVLLAPLSDASCVNVGFHVRLSGCPSL